MKAAQISEYGGEDALKIVEDTKKPGAGKDQVLVMVYSTSVNPFDWKVRDGSYQQYIPIKFPATLGGDVAGIVSEIGEGVTGFEVGQEVYGLANAVSGQGSFAEYTPVNIGQLALKPQELDFNTAAAVPLVSISAYQALIDHINLQKGQKILIHGGAGGIGAGAIQIAKNIGAYVATTVSPKDLDYVTGLGADEAIDYKNQDFTRLIKNYDAVFDTVGGETTSQSYQVLKSGAPLVSMVEQPNEELAKKYDVTFTYQQTGVTTDRLNKISELIKEKKLTINIDKVFQFDEIAKALEYLKTGHPRGKVVVQVKS